MTSLVFASLLLISGLSSGRAAATGLAPVNGTRLWYQVAGRGPAVVLIHGGLVDSRLWDDQIAPLSRSFRVVRYDLRGFGKSETPTGPFSPLEDLRALLDFLSIDRATLVGLSIGGQIATDFALEYPARVDRLVLSGASLRGFSSAPDPKTRHAYRVGAAEGPEKYFDAFLDADLLAGVRTRPAARARMRRMMLDNFKALSTLSPEMLQFPQTPTIDRLGEIHARTLVIVGSIDAPALRQIADTLSTKIPGARKVVIPGASHHPPVETPAEFNRILIDFLRAA